jgi:hypothetical protein
MPRDGAIVFGDLIGKLDMLRVVCDKCGRDGCYGLSRLIEGRGRDAKLVDWLDEITADSAKKRRWQYERFMRRTVSAIAEGAVTTPPAHWLVYFRPPCVCFSRSSSGSTSLSLRRSARVSRASS